MKTIKGTNKNLTEWAHCILQWPLFAYHTVSTKTSHRFLKSDSLWQ